MPPTLSPGLLLAGRYQLVSALGTSDVGAVYCAMDQVSGRECAVKVLDPALRQEMLALVKDVCQRQQLTMLMVSHSIEDAARIAPRSVVIAEGRILWDGATEALMSGKESASGLLGIKP